MNGQICEGPRRFCRVQLLVGVESLVYSYRGFGDKQADWGRVMAALYAIQDHGIAVCGCFVLGADGETTLNH